MGPFGGQMFRPICNSLAAKNGQILMKFNIFVYFVCTTLQKNVAKIGILVARQFGKNS